MEVVGAEVGDIGQKEGVALLYVRGKWRDSKDNFVIITE